MINIIHTPYGQEHPYEQLPEERFPRQPLADEPFTAGIATRPPETVQRVVVHQTLDGASLADIEAQNLAQWKPKWEEGVGAEFLERIVKIDQDVWQANLTAPAFGQTLTYWAEADGVATPKFTLRGEAWQRSGGATFDGQTLTVSRSAAETNFPANLPALTSVEWLTDGVTARRVRLTFRASADESFFGLGERFNALDQRGNIMDIRCYEQYKNQDKRTYMPIPFLLSSAGYGVHVQSSRWMQFDLAATSPDVWTLEADLGTDETLNLRWFTAMNPLRIIADFSMSTGDAPLPPLWAFGLWMSANEWNTQARVEEEVNLSLQHDIQPSVVVIEAWSDETTFYIWNDAQYTPKAGSEKFSYADFTFPADGKWPNPKGMVDGLHDKNIKLLLWQIPALKRLEQPHAQHEADIAHFEQNGFGIHEADGTLHKIRPFWFRGGYIWDATNPAARDWWLDKRAYLLDDIGIDGFKTDGGEHLWGADTRFGDGRAGDELWNEYPLHYTEAYYKFATSKREAVTFSRAGFTGSQRAPLHWAGDENSTWDAFKHSILAGLSAAVSGITFWGWDIGGFSGAIPTAELFLRSTAMAAFCPVMQYHSEYNGHRNYKEDRSPWNMQERTGDETILPTFRHFLNVRHNLMPYIWREARHSAETGEPMMRALKLWEAQASDYQYYFGRDLLVCPVVEPDVSVWNVYLPDGEWLDLWTKQRFSGGKHVTVDAPMTRIPVFIRANTHIPAHLGQNNALGDAVPLDATQNSTLVFE